MPNHIIYTITHGSWHILLNPLNHLGYMYLRAGDLFVKLGEQRFPDIWFLFIVILVAISYVNLVGITKNDLHTFVIPH